MGESERNYRLGGIEDPEHGPEYPEVVCLCGSTRFKSEYRTENARLTLGGKIVLSVGFSTTLGTLPRACRKLLVSLKTPRKRQNSTNYTFGRSSWPTASMS